MDLSYSDDQRLLKESVERVLADGYDVARRARYIEERGGYSAQLWQTYAELGLLGVPFAESLGGLGGGAVEVMIVMEAFGRAMAVEPYLPSVVLAGGLLRRAASSSQQQRLLTPLIEGRLTLALATTEPTSGYELAHVTTRARRTKDGWILEGAKSVVLGGGSAATLIIPARVSGADEDPAGIGLFLIESSAVGVGRRAYLTQDGHGAADLTLAGVHCGAEQLLGEAEGGYPVLLAAVEEGMAALCAEAVGAMDRLLSLTLEYLKTRKQFGQPLGQFQALQHRAVDMFVALEQARSMALYATLMLSCEDADERHRAVLGAKAQVGAASRRLGQEAVQMHGAMGMTNEYACGPLFKRLTMIDSSLGHARHVTRELAALGGLPG